MNSGPLPPVIQITCFYVIQHAVEKNVTIHFSEFVLIGGNADDYENNSFSDDYPVRLQILVGACRR